MSYESMINLFTKDMQMRLMEEEEKQIVKAVQEIGINVNKEELIRALEYDRDQYKRGYKDRDAEIVRCKDCIVSETFQRDSNGTTERYCKAFTHLRRVADDDYCSYGERREL